MTVLYSTLRVTPNVLLKITPLTTPFMKEHHAYGSPFFLQPHPAINFLIETGTLLHFPDTSHGLCTLYFLCPVWLSECLERIMHLKSSRSVARNGVIHAEDLRVRTRKQLVKWKKFEASSSNFRKKVLTFWAVLCVNDETAFSWWWIVMMSDDNVCLCRCYW